MLNKDYASRQYQIVPYDPIWPDQFIGEAKVLRSIFKTAAVAIEHIGSTATVGMSGKPTIDVLITVDDIAVADKLVQQMEAAGYRALGEYVTPGTRLFAREKDNTRICNVHVAPKGHTKARELLAWRDYFNSHQHMATRYSQLKLRLFKKYANDYASYRKYKDEWIDDLKVKLQAQGII